MGRSVNVPLHFSEVARFVRSGEIHPRKDQQQAKQVSFFRGYEGGVLKHFVACHYVDSEGVSSFWSRACNGRNVKEWERFLQEMREEPIYPEVTLPADATKATWLRAG